MFTLCCLYEADEWYSVRKVFDFSSKSFVCAGLLASNGAQQFLQLHMSHALSTFSRYYMFLSPFLPYTLSTVNCVNNPACVHLNPTLQFHLWLQRHNGYHLMGTYQKQSVRHRKLKLMTIPTLNPLRHRVSRKKTKKRTCMGSNENMWVVKTLDLFLRIWRMCQF